MPRPRILMADDHQMLLDAFTVMLEQDFDVVGAVTDGRSLLQEFARLNPDVVLLDVAMPLLNGLDAARQLKATHRTVKLIFLTMNPDPDLAGPVHQIMLVVNGIHLLENLRLDELAGRRAYEFALIVEPLKIQGGTGSTVAPVAVR